MREKGMTKEEMLAMGDAIELMAQRIPLARKELVEIAATAGRLGIQGRDNILNFTEVVAMMATATVLSADEAANALARVSNAFQLPIANVEYLGSIINELSNTTASNSREIVKSIENVGASGKMMGIPIDAVAAMSATLIAAGMSSERSGCVDDETEILTKDGWKGIDEISENDYIATRSPDGNLEYRKPDLIYRRNWNGKMIHFKKRTTDILVTPDHRMIIKPQWKDDYYKLEAKEMLGKSNFKIPATVKWEGTEIKYFELPETSYINAKKINFPKRDVSMKSWVKFMAYFLSEGSLYMKDHTYRITLAQKEGDVKDAMKKVLSEMGFDYKIKKDKMHIDINNKQLVMALKEFEGSYAHSKYIPEYIKNLPIVYLEIFLDAYIEGDGDLDKREGHGGGKKVFSSSRQLIDDLAEITLKCGYRFSEFKAYEKDSEFEIHGKTHKRNYDCIGLNISKNKYVDAHFVNCGRLKEQVFEEDYNGRIFCPILPPYETIFVKRNGKTAWIFQTRLRRFFTEMARNSAKMAEEMDIDAATMKISIEEDPTKAIMDYLEHLRELPTRLEKIVEAQEIFGKVGGFAVATLSENYVDLEKNMSNARTELAFGTSLQREFEIATSKTSAQLQMLDNRIEAATASIGEDFVPAIKGGKSALADMAEILSEVSEGFWSVGENAEIAGSQIDVLVDEMARLRREAEEGVTSWNVLGILIKAATGETIGLADPREQKQSVKAILDVISGTKDLEKETKALNKMFEIQDQLTRSANVAFGMEVKNIKELTDFKGKHGDVLKDIEDLNIKIRDSERGMTAAEKEGHDVSKERNQLMIDEEIIRIRGMQITRNALKEKIESQRATEEEKNRYAEISKYLDGYVDKNGNIIKVLSKKNAAERLSGKISDWNIEKLGKEDTLYIQLHGAIGDYADEIMMAADPQKALNDLGYEAVMIGDQLNIVLVEEAKRLYDLVEPTLRITKTFEKFNKVTSESFEDLVERMIKVREESSLLYYDITNQASAWNELGNIMITDNKTMRESISNFTDLEKTGRRLVITHKGLEAITTAEAAKMKKLGKEIIYVTDAMEEMNELGQDSITIWGQLTIAQSDYEDRLNSVWGLTSSYINTLRKLGDAQLLFAEATDTMPMRIQELWRPYEKTFDEIQSLVAAGEDYEAGLLIQNMALDMHQKKMSATSKQERKDLDKMMGYMDDYVQSVGLVPLEYKEIQDEVQLLEDLMRGISEGEIIITPDLNDTPFSDAMKRLLDADYITSVRVEANLVEVKKQIEEAGALAAIKPEVISFVTPEAEKKMAKAAQEPYGVQPGPWMEDYDFMEKYTKGEIDVSALKTSFEKTIEEPGIVTKVVEGITNVGTIVGNAIADPVGTLKTVAEKFDTTVEKLDQSLTGGKIGAGLEYVGGGLKTIGEGVKDILPKWLGGNELGGPISKTGLYTLHEGEHVLNKHETSHVKNVHAALGISSIAPSMQTGGHIKKTGLYNLHEGEHVLAKDEVKNPLVSSDEVLSKMWGEINNATPHQSTETSIVDSMNEGGGVDKDGLYQLHKGEEILSKPDVDAIEKNQKIIKEGSTMNYDTKNERSNVFNNPISKAVSNIKNDYNNPNNNIEGERIINIHIGTIALDENYDVKKFIHDMEIIAMSG